jgi:hypothetical protein
MDTELLAVAGAAAVDIAELKALLFTRKKPLILSRLRDMYGMLDHRRRSSASTILRRRQLRDLQRFLHSFLCVGNPRQLKIIGSTYIELIYYFKLKAFRNMIRMHCPVHANGLYCV